MARAYPPVSWCVGGLLSELVFRDGQGSGYKDGAAMALGGSARRGSQSGDAHTVRRCCGPENPSPAPCASRTEPDNADHLGYMVTKSCPIEYMEDKFCYMLIN